MQFFFNNQLKSINQLKIKIMKRIYEVKAYRTEEDFNNRNYEIINEGISSLSEAKYIAKDAVNTSLFYAVKYQSSDREKIEILYRPS